MMVLISVNRCPDRIARKAVAVGDYAVYLRMSTCAFFFAASWAVPSTRSVIDPATSYYAQREHTSTGTCLMMTMMSPVPE
jgi:hypothetical protein